MVVVNARRNESYALVGGLNTFGPINPTFHVEPSESMRRTLLFDPTPIYDPNAKWASLINHYKRNNYIGMEHLFPQPDLTVCACGCGEKLAGRRTRYASDICKNHAVRVYLVLRGDSDVIKRLMLHYLPHECVSCHCPDYEVTATKMVTWGGREPFETTTYCASGLHVEHIVAVKDGGGCCWLGNFQFMCHRCHAVKTAGERQMRNKQSAMPVSKLW